MKTGAPPDCAVGCTSTALPQTSRVAVDASKRVTPRNKLSLCALRPRTTPLMTPGNCAGQRRQISLSGMQEVHPMLTITSDGERIGSLHKVCECRRDFCLLVREACESCDVFKARRDIQFASVARAISCDVDAPRRNSWSWSETLSWAIAQAVADGRGALECLRDAVSGGANRMTPSPRDCAPAGSLPTSRDGSMSFR